MNARLETGRKMAALRKGKKLTQAELAQALGISQRMVAAIEAGERRPSVSLAQRIGQELGFSWTDFFEKSDNVDGNGQGARA